MPRDDPLYGQQEGRHFHGYYDCYCYLPLYIFCGRHLLAAKLRSSSADAAEGSVEEVARIVAQIRARWPTTSIVLRADSGFCGSRPTKGSRVLMEEVKFDRERVTSVDWSSYPIMQFSDAPNIYIDLIDRPSEPPPGARRGGLHAGWRRTRQRRLRCSRCAVA